MTFKLASVTAADGHKLNIRALPARGGPKDRFATWIHVKPKPKGMAASVGTEYYAYTEGDQAVSVRK